MERLGLLLNILIWSYYWYNSSSGHSPFTFPLKWY